MSHKMRRVLVLTAALALTFYLAYPFIEVARPWFSVVGVDVSHYQGRIDWPKVAQANVRFAYLKATEGGDYVDPTFAENWQAAQAAGLAVGAYHFFTRCKTGHEQAQNLLNVLPRAKSALPPVIDAEKIEPCATGTADLAPVPEIAVMLAEVEQALGCRPIIYTTPEFEAAYLHGQFASETFWMRSILFPPLQRRSTWMFWQYHNAGRRPGIETPVDLNVFRGTADDFANFRESHACIKGL